jgi:flagellar hook-associated protein 2
MTTTSGAASFRASGLATGIDTGAIIDQLIKIGTQPIDLLRQRQSGMAAQVSTLGDLVSKLQDLSKTATTLGDGGTLGTKVSSTSTGFSATSDAKAIAGRYDVKVGTLASAAQQRSAAFTDGTSPVRGGTLDMTVMGKPYQVVMPDGATLADVALLIRQSGAPVNATVLSNGSAAYLSITNLNTGFPLTGVAADALSITETTTGVLGQALGAAETQPAGNASVTVNGLPFTRQSNTATDVIPGVTLTLKATTAATESLVVDNDVEGTAKNLQKFVDSYNSVLKLVQAQLQPAANTDRTVTLAGDGALRNLQATLHRVLTTVVGSSDVRSLADVGVKSSRDGSLTLDSTALGKAVALDPSAVNDLFSKTSTGLGAVVKGLVDAATNSVDGTLITRKKGLNDNIRRMDTQADLMQARLDAYRDQLVSQFTAMEKVVSGLKATGNFLSQQTSSLSGGR